MVDNSKGRKQEENMDGRMNECRQKDQQHEKGNLEVN